MTVQLPGIRRGSGQRYMCSMLTRRYLLGKRVMKEELVARAHLQIVTCDGCLLTNRISLAAARNDIPVQ